MMKHHKKLFTFLILGIGISLFFSNPAQAQGLFIRGDINCDGVVDTVDLTIFTYVFSCKDIADVDDNGTHNQLTDSTYLANYIYFGGPPPPYPFPTCGADTTADSLTCIISCCCTLATECNDGLDNDGDGLVDYPEDPSCANACDDIEAFTQCDDGLDNDGDGFRDYLQDCGCANAYDSTEAPNPVTECNDGIDNDGDGSIDLADCGCFSICDFTEVPNIPNIVTQCTDGIDNDGDGLIDLADPYCCNDCSYSEYFAYKPGDFNGNGSINLVDIVGLVGYVFKSGPSPSPKCLGDANGNGSLTLTDIVFLVNFVFKNGVDPIPSGVCCNPT